MADDDYDHGPLQTFEVTWKNGHVERLKAHQVSYPGSAAALLLGRRDSPEVVEFHGQFDGHWRLVLRAPVDMVSIVRNVTLTETEVLDE